MPELFAIIDRFEGDKAVLVFSDGQELVIDRGNLALDAKEGDSVDVKFQFNFRQTEIAAKEAEILLKKIINKKHETT